jgi:lipopolysaccharide export system protein LptA
MNRRVADATGSRAWSRSAEAASRSLAIMVTPRLAALTLAALMLAVGSARAQGIDLTQGGPIQITARDGLDWRQAEQVVIAKGDAKAVRGNVTVTGDRLYAWYRRKGGEAAPQQVATGVTAADDTEGNEVYRMRAEGNVHIYTQTDQAWGDQATYDLDEAVMVMTGHALKLTTPNDTLTARDTMEYWSQKHMAVARGDAVIVTNDARRVSADTLVAYTVQASPGSSTTQTGSTAPASTTQAATAPGSTAPGSTASGSAPAGATQAGSPPHVQTAGTQPGQSAARTSGDPLVEMAGKLQRVEAFNNVSVRTVTDIVTGDRGVYVPDTDIAHIGGHVRITRGANQVNGSEAVVNMKTGIATLLAGNSGRVTGLIVPNDQSVPPPPADTANKPPQTKPSPARPGAEGKQ